MWAAGRSLRRQGERGHAGGADDFGAQGGDPARGVAIDLSTCVNRYGPAPAALDALRCVKPGHVLMHPYDAAQRLCEVYATTLGVDAGELLTSRASSEVIWAMRRTLGLAISVLGIVLVLGAGLIYAGYLMVGRALGRHSDSMVAACWLAAGAALSCLNRGLAVDGLDNPSGHWSVLLGYGLATAVAFWFTFAALARIGASCTAVVMTFEAVTAAVLGALILGEQLGALQAIGGVSVLAAAVLIATTAGNDRSSRTQVLIPKVEEVAV